MWNMMCDVMPTISEDSISQRSSQFSGEDANFEQLMVSMLDERDKLMDSLRETQERLSDTELKLADVEKERDSLQRQIAANFPQKRKNYGLRIRKVNYYNTKLGVTLKITRSRIEIPKNVTRRNNSPNDFHLNNLPTNYMNISPELIVIAHIVCESSITCTPHQDGQSSTDEVKASSSVRPETFGGQKKRPAREIHV
ncbi:hypothetical protein FQA39_LY14646 [Lamprigera yunnana]|nr:hypothetical protein FQA39_LY14646 [Lamprigera yunnana]